MASFRTSEEPKDGDGGHRAAEPGGQSTRRGIVIVVAAGVVHFLIMTSRAREHFRVGERTESLLID